MRHILFTLFGAIEAHARRNTEKTDLERTLQSLALGKKRVLKKSTKGQDILKTDTFRFAADFTDPRYQIHIKSIQAKETARLCSPSGSMC